MTEHNHLTDPIFTGCRIAADDERWTAAYANLCYAQLRAKQEGLPQVAELINNALDRLMEPSGMWDHGERIDTT